MGHVFISYARPDEASASRVADALRGQGYEVWRDDELPAHKAYTEVIEERLKSAQAVVVLWSAEAVKSEWVRAEADVARNAGTLIQATLDSSMPPLPFNQIHCARIEGWTGDPKAAAWAKLSASVAALAGPTAAREEGRRPPRRERSIAVLPFQNMSGDPEQEYFSDGISEDITTDLSKISALRVVARNTAFTFKGQSVDVCECARKLNVSHVLEGSVRKAGNRLRITAQLIDGATGDHLWAERYDRDLTDIFAIQDEITKEIVAALKLKLLPEEKKAIEERGTSSAEAYNYYLMARQYWLTGNHGDRRREERVVRLCGRALEIDPQYAQALALMALAQISLRFGFGDTTQDGLPTAEKALAIDPSIAVAHSAKARFFLEQGRHAEANREIARALELEPESWEVNKEAGRVSLSQRRIPEATRFYEKAAQLMEGDFHTWAMLLTCYEAAGDRDKARHAGRMMFSEAQKALEKDPSNGAALGIAAGGLAAMGEVERVKEWIDKAMLLDGGNLNMRYNFACVLAAQLNDVEGAIALLETTITRALSSQVRLAATDPDLDNLRGNPRFETMLADAQRRVGLAPGSPNPTPEAEAPPRS